MKAESRQIPQKLAARLKFAYCLFCEITTAGLFMSLFCEQVNTRQLKMLFSLTSILKDIGLWTPRLRCVISQSGGRCCLCI